jgi:hypothetical protein
MSNISPDTLKLLNFVTQEAEAIHDAELLEEANWKSLGIEPEKVAVSLPKDLAFKVRSNYLVDPMRITKIFQNALQKELAHV